MDNGYAELSHELTDECDDLILRVAIKNVLLDCMLKGYTPAMALKIITQTIEDELKERSD